MKKFFFILTLLYSNSLAQKHQLDTSILEKFPQIGDAAISSDGKYFLYAVNNPKSSRTLIIRKVSGNWRKEIHNGMEAMFSEDCKNVFCLVGSDSLFRMVLGTDNIRYTPNVNKFQLSGRQNEILAYKEKNVTEQLVLDNLNTGEKRTFANAEDFSFSTNGESLWMKIKNVTSSDTTYILKMVSLPNTTPYTIWEGKEEPIQLTFDSEGKQLAFILNGRGDMSGKTTIWYWNQNNLSASKIVDKDTPGVDSNVTIFNTGPTFSKDGKRIYFRLYDENDYSRKLSDACCINIWKYNDATLKSQQLEELKPYYYSFHAIVNIKDKRVLRLESDSERIYGNPDSQNGDFVVVNKAKGHVFEIYWNKSSQPTVYLKSLISGSSKLIAADIKRESDLPRLSPEGKWVYWYNSDQNNYYTYEIATGIIRNITSSIKTNWVKKEEEILYPNIWGAYWSAADKYIFILDNYDIWKVDPTASTPPVNITNGYGKRENIRFGFMMEGEDLRRLEINDQSELLLQAFNLSNKQSGFCKVTLKEISDPIILFMGPFNFDWQIIHAKNSKSTIVRRESATDAPNYFKTDDFRSYTRLTDIQPQKNYNWYTTQLITWKTPDDNSSQGILYKPENFDPNKKYPVIFHFYESMSNNLNCFLYPEFSNSDLNIPYFVSNGYLVFTPDIHYTIGSPGKSASDAIISAADYLSQFPWIDTSKMGLQGHSWGGYETNYIITQSNKFKAAMSAAGISNFVSDYGSLSHGETSKQHWYEIGQCRIGGCLWDNMESFINNSPIFMVNKISTPLLLMHNKMDVQVPMSQSIELFSALRRLRKPVWLLQYSRGAHGVIGLDAIDFHEKLVDFFDFFLKDKEQPNWMK